MKTLVLVLVIQVLRGVASSKDRPAAGSKVMGYRLARDERDAAESTRQKDVLGDPISRKEREAAESTRPEGEAKENLTTIRVDDSDGDGDSDDDRDLVEIVEILDDLIDKKVAEALKEVNVKVEKSRVKVARLEDQIATMKREMLSCESGRKHHYKFTHNWHTAAKVEFTKPFTKPPHVLLSIDKLRTFGTRPKESWGAYIPVYYDVAKTVTKSGFVTDMVVWMPARPNVTKPNVEMKFSWLASGYTRPRIYKDIALDELEHAG